MPEIWFAIVWFMVAVYVVLDGRNLGAAALRPLVARTEQEGRVVRQAIGSMWSWHEVWLIAAGGALLLAFPSVLAATFAGLYLALFLVLWLLILRGIALELGDHIDHPLWRSFWGLVLSGSSGLLALSTGLTLGNLLRGVPLGAAGELQMPLFTNFTARGEVGIIDWYTMLVSLLLGCVLCAHGATFLVWRADGRVRARSRVVSRRAWLAAIPLAALAVIATCDVRPDLTAALFRPATLAFVLVVALGAVAVATGSIRRHAHRAYAGSCAVVLGLVGASASTMFPVLLRSTEDPAFSLSARGAAVGRDSLMLGLSWWLVAIPFTIGLALIMRRAFRAPGIGESVTTEAAQLDA